MKRRVPELVIGFLLGVVLMSVVFLLNSDAAAHYQICENTHAGAKECANYNVLSYALHKIWTALDALNGAITAIATAFIAWFTFSLRRSTDKLWDAGERQLGFLRENSEAQSRDMQDSIAVGQRSAKAAEEAAQAANRNAKAAIHVELPIVTIKKLELHRNLGVVEKVNGGDIPAETNIVIDFKNRGRSAAELRSLTIQWEVCQKLRPEPFYRPDSKYPFAPGIYMEPNKTLPAGEGRFYVRLSDKHLTAISEETEFFWIYGLVAFADFMGEPHEARFCAKWVRYASHGDGALKPMGFVYDSEAPAAYTRNT